MEAANSALLDSEEFLKTREAPAQVSGDTADMALSASHARIDRKLRSKNALGHAMSEEASNQWFTEFVACPDWNQKVWENGNGEVSGNCRIVDSNLIWCQPCYRLSRSHRIRQSEGLPVAWPYSRSSSP